VTSSQYRKATRRKRLRGEKGFQERGTPVRSRWPLASGAALGEDRLSILPYLTKVRKYGSKK
jgi:hypothetical protein